MNILESEESNPIPLIEFFLEHKKSIEVLITDRYSESSSRDIIFFLSLVTSDEGLSTLLFLHTLMVEGQSHLMPRM